MFTASVDETVVPDYVVVKVGGDVDISSEDQFRQALAEAAERHRPLVIDLADVGYFGVCGVRCLLEVELSPTGVQKSPVLIAPSGGVVIRILQMVGLTERWPVFSGVEQVSPTAASDLEGPAGPRVCRR
jgi:anti-anti-sigma factor